MVRAWRHRAERDRWTLRACGSTTSSNATTTTPSITRAAANLGEQLLGGDQRAGETSAELAIRGDVVEQAIAAMDLSRSSVTTSSK